MNRETKFRAWDNNKKEWIDLSARSEDGFVPKNVFYQCPKDGLMLLGSGGYAYNATIQQWTGIKDLKGKDIYDGDIVIVEDSYSDIYKQERIVSYTKCQACDTYIGWALFFPFDWLVEDEWYNRKSMEPIMKMVGDVEVMQDYSLEGKSYEVIGNVFENKDLLIA